MAHLLSIHEKIYNFLNALFNKKLLFIEKIFIKGLHFGNKDDKIILKKAAFVETARENGFRIAEVTKDAMLEYIW